MEFEILRYSSVALKLGTTALDSTLFMITRRSEGNAFESSASTVGSNSRFRFEDVPVALELPEKIGMRSAFRALDWIMQPFFQI